MGEDRTPVPPGWVAQAVRRASRPDFGRWDAMVHASGCCAQPVRLSGRVWADDGEGGVVSAYRTSGEADGVLLKACGTRRATRCPACAATYRGDAKALLRAGLAIPDYVKEGDPSVAGPPVIFVTLTAPSFGAVHRCRTPPAACRPRQVAACGHGWPARCPVVHEPHDPAVGSAICVDCYDWEGAVMFNARAGELWRRTTIAVTRHLAVAAGVPVRHFARHHRLEFAKVIEFQARGVIHVHALARLDPRHGADATARTPEVVVDSADLCAAFAAAATATIAPNPLRAASPIRWGAQCDIQPVPAGRRRAAAAYVAKYATKSVDGGGQLDRRLTHSDLDHLDLPPQLRRMCATAWELGGRDELAGLHLRAWAHSLGYRGHWLTKSRGWSTTFGQLRAARQTWKLAQLGIDPADLAGRVGEWEYRGIGHLNAGDAWLAASANTARRQNRRVAWEHR